MSLNYDSLIITIFNSLALKMNIHTVLDKAETLLLEYCRQSITKTFKEVNL